MLKFVSAVAKRLRPLLLNISQNASVPFCYKREIKEEINSSGLTIKEIAERVGVSPEMITQYKTTTKMPSIEIKE